MSTIQNLLTTPGDYSFVPGSSGQATIILKAGGGGGGGVCYNPDPPSSAAPAGGGGGGGGGSALTTQQLQQGVQYYLTVGKGGAVNSNNPQSDPGGNTSLTGGEINLGAYGGQGGYRGYFGAGGAGGNGGVPDGGGGGGAGGGNNGFGPNPSAAGGAGGAGAAQGAPGGNGGDCQNYMGAASGGGGAGGYNAPGGAAGDGSQSSPGQGGNPPQDFSQLLTPGPGLNGQGTSDAPSGTGFGGGGGGASVISASDVSGQGGMGDGLLLGPGGSTPGNDGLACLYFSETINFVPISRPRILSFSPSSGGTGILITIQGSNFSPTPANNVVAFGDWDVVPVVSATETTITVLTPTMSIHNQKSFPLYVRTNDVVSDPSTSEFTFLPPPVINSLIYSPIGIGADLKILGNNFRPSPLLNKVYFTGGVTKSPMHGDVSSLTLAVPEGVQTGPMYVQNAGGQSNSIQLVIQPTPTITSIQPDGATVGDIITINGTGFSTVRSENVVEFPGGIRVGVLTATPTQLTVMVPYETYSGGVRVSINGVPSSKVVFKVIRVPVLLSFSPLAVNYGATLTIKGNFYSTYDTIQIIYSANNNFRNYGPTKFIDVNTLQAIIPQAAWSGPIQLALAGYDLKSPLSAQPLIVEGQPPGMEPST